MKKKALLAVIAAIGLAGLGLYFYLGSSSYRQARVASMLDEARLLVAGGELVAAEDILDEAIALDPDNPDPYMAKAEVQEKLGDVKSAFGTYAEAAIRSHSVDAALAAARLAAPAGRPGQAIAFLESAGKMDPDNPDILFKLGYNYSLQRDFENAAEVYKKLIEIVPHDPDAYTGLALVYAEQDQLDQAAAVLETAIKNNPQKPGLLNELGNLYMLNENYEKAVEAFERAVEMNPDYKDAGQNLIHARRELERTRSKPAEPAQPSEPANQPPD